MNQKIVLILYYSQNNYYSFNALAGALETDRYFDNLRVEILTNENDLFLQLENLKKKYSKIILAFSFFTSQLFQIEKIIKKIQIKFGKKIFCIAGGAHPTGAKFETLKMGFDLVVSGEGEETFIYVLKKIFNEDDYKTIKGIAFINEKGEYKYNEPGPAIDLNKYPPFSEKFNLFGPIEISRGCSFGCYFCQTSIIFGRKPRYRSIESICKYVSILRKKKFKNVRFISPDAFAYGSGNGRTVNIYYLEELLFKIRENAGKNMQVYLGSFPSEVRPEHVSREALNLILKYADNDNLIIGAQSGSQRMLDLCHRGHSIEEVYNAVEMIIGSGLKANVDFIFGLPGEIEEDIVLTLNVIDKLVNMGARIHTHTFMPLPLTPFAHAEVKIVNDKIKKMINKISAKGFAYGMWLEQEKIALKIAENFKKNRYDGK